jgi:hypothetical protein
VANPVIVGFEAVFVTVNESGLLATPFTVKLTDTAPGVRFGTLTVTEELDHDATAADIAPKFTMLEPWLAPRALPLIVRVLPAGPDAGLSALMLIRVLALAWFDGADSPLLFAAVTT